LQSVANYFGFIYSNCRFLSYGLLMAFGSSFGQTYFISLFGAEIRSEYGLTHGGFGSLYSVATMCSAVTLVWLGRKVDTLDLRIFSLACTLGLGAAALAMAFSFNIYTLLITLFLLRLNGQGLMTHAAMTSMARYFDKARGRALSIASLGFPTGEGVLPIVAVSLVAFTSWREAWMIIAGVLILVITPSIQALLTNHGERDKALKVRVTERLKVNAGKGDWSRRQILRDIRFYIILPAVLAPSFISTGLFFHQVHIITVKGWSLSWFATCFVAFAICQLTSSIIIGPLVDRHGAKRLLPFFLLPSILALGVLTTGNSSAIALLFMMLLGLTSGASSTISGALWAEIYGITHLGAIRAMAMALMVLASALSPAILGLFIDIGTSVDALAYGMGGYAILASLLAYRISGR